MWYVRKVRNITSYLSHGSHKVTVYAVTELPTSKFLGEQLAFYGHVVIYMLIFLVIYPNPTHFMEREQ